MEVGEERGGDGGEKREGWQTDWVRWGGVREMVPRNGDGKSKRRREGGREATTPQEATVTREAA